MPAKPLLNGWLVKDPVKPEIYLIIDGYKCHIVYPESMRIFKPDPIINTHLDLDDIPTGPPITYAQLVKRDESVPAGPERDKIYFFTNEGKRHIPNFEVFDRFQFDRSRISAYHKSMISDRDYPLGPPLVGPPLE